MYLYRQPYPDRIQKNNDQYASFNKAMLSQRARYFIAFKFRNPFAYLIWYRYRLTSTLTAEERADILSEFRYWEQRNDKKADLAIEMSADDEFALWHPWLFLCWEAFQFLKQILSAPGKVVTALKRNTARTESTDDAVVEHKLV